MSTDEVFISYSYDSPVHVQRVLELSNRLRGEGIECVLDQYEESPSEGWPRWMDRKIRDAKHVLVICTETYLNRIMGDEAPNKGLGVKWEGTIAYQHLYNSGLNNDKFIPVIFEEQDYSYIPIPLQPFTHYNVAEPIRYDRLYKRLTGQPHIQKPELGARRPLPYKPVKTDPKLFFISPIDIDLWNQAKWRATFFMFAPGVPPVLGLAFRDESSAKEIFKGWHDRFGDNDQHEEIRVSIIEGDIPGEDAGYTVHLGPDIDGFSARYKEAGLEIKEDLLMCVSRLNRMTPPPESRNLENFKAAFKVHKTYYLAPGVVSEDGKQMTPLTDLAIFKNKIHFRHVDDIGEHDPDLIVFKDPERELK